MTKRGFLRGYGGQRKKPRIRRGSGGGKGLPPELPLLQSVKSTVKKGHFPRQAGPHSKLGTMHKVRDEKGHPFCENGDHRKKGELRAILEGDGSRRKLENGMICSCLGHRTKRTKRFDG